MNAPAAFEATVHGFRTVPTRKVVQVTIEAPIERHAEIAKIAEHGAWVAVARLQRAQKHDNDNKRWGDLSEPQQAGIMCTDPIFWKFIQEEKGVSVMSESEAAQFVRRYCGVNSRSQLGDTHPARDSWRILSNEFRAWKAAENVR